MKLLKIFCLIVSFFLLTKTSYPQDKENLSGLRSGIFTSTIKSGIKLYTLKHPNPDYSRFDNFFTVFGDMKYNFQVNRQITPFVFADLGYSFTRYSGKGLMFDTGIGMKLWTSENFNFIFDLGYKSQRLFYVGYDMVGDTFRYAGTINSLTFNTGFQF